MGRVDERELLWVAEDLWLHLLSQFLPELVELPCPGSQLGVRDLLQQPGAVLPVLRSPGQQLLPRGLEVLLDECLQLLWGNVVLVGGRQLTEVLQNLVWS